MLSNIEILDKFLSNTFEIDEQQISLLEDALENQYPIIFNGDFVLVARDNKHIVRVLPDVWEIYYEDRHLLIKDNEFNTSSELSDVLKLPDTLAHIPETFTKIIFRRRDNFLYISIFNEYREVTETIKYSEETGEYTGHSYKVRVSTPNEIDIKGRVFKLLRALKTDIPEEMLSDFIDEILDDNGILDFEAEDLNKFQSIYNTFTCKDVLDKLEYTVKNVDNIVQFTKGDIILVSSKLIFSLSNIFTGDRAKIEIDLYSDMIDIIVLRSI